MDNDPTKLTEEFEQLKQENKALQKEIFHMQRLASAGTMLSLVAHEFNNLLTPMVNYSKQALQKNSFAEKALQCTTTNGQRAADICRAMLDFTSESQNISDPIRFEELLNQTLLIMGKTPEKDSIDLIRDWSGDLVIKKNRLIIQQVLLNILLNAKAAVMKNNGPRRITISVSTASIDLVVKIADNGMGITDDIIDQIFQPFFTTKGKLDANKKGRGLGLAVCTEMLHSVGGKIAVESPKGKGASFTFQLPF